MANVISLFSVVYKVYGQCTVFKITPNQDPKELIGWTWCPLLSFQLEILNNETPKFQTSDPAALVAYMKANGFTMEADEFAEVSGIAKSAPEALPKKRPISKKSQPAPHIVSNTSSAEDRNPSFKEIAEKNQQTKEKLAQERLKNNVYVLKSYNIK
jgi:hypothetical protein